MTYITVPHNVVAFKKGMSNIHNDIIDYVVTCQGHGRRVTQGMIAERFGYTQAWLSRLLSSDAFQERIAQRRGELKDPEMIRSIREGFEELVSAAQEALMKEIQRPQPNLKAVTAALEIGSRHLTDQRKTDLMAEGVGDGGTSLDDRIALIARKMNSLFTPAAQERIINGQIIDGREAEGNESGQVDPEHPSRGPSCGEDAHGGNERADGAEASEPNGTEGGTAVSEPSTRDRNPHEVQG